MLCIWVLDKTMIPSPWTTHMDYPKWTTSLKFSDQD